jgi:serine/threonine-protein phosphatase 2A activator
MTRCSKWMEGCDEIIEVHEAQSTSETRNHEQLKCGDQPRFPAVTTKHDRKYMILTMDAPPRPTLPRETQGHPGSRNLQTLNLGERHTFIKPVKRINEGHDVPVFLTSKAYVDIGTFVMQLNIAMCPRKSPGGEDVHVWQLDSDIPLSEPVRKLQELLQSIDAIIKEAPPDTGPRRFGNVSFRKWYEILEERVETLLKDHLPKAVLEFNSSDGENGNEKVEVLDELTPYLMGAFGSPQRLDYGTGHELSFLAFLGCIWKLGGFKHESLKPEAVERSIVVGIIEP